MTTLLSVVILLVLIAAGAAHGQEQRCRDLGAGCACSEPLNASTPGWGGVSWYNPPDSTPATKECYIEGPAGSAIVRNSGDLTQTNDPALLGLLPPGHAVANVLRGPAGHQGTWMLGTNMIAPADSGKQRLAARWYVYHSPEMFSPGDCGGSKFGRWFYAWTPGYAQVSSIIGSGYAQIYNFLPWTPSQDCCLAGPGPDTNKAGPTFWQGKWVRVEFIAVRPDGKGATNPGTGPVFQIYVKDVTNNTPELLVVDTSYAGGQLNPTTPFRDPPASYSGGIIQTIMSDAHRQPGFNGEPCRGFKAFSHFMAAAWDRDEGQRIGAATEIEGGSAPPPPPPPPPTPIYTLNLAITGTGTCTLNREPVTTWPEGSTVLLGAFPTTGSEFKGWTGDADCTDAIVTMNADKTCVAICDLVTAPPPPPPPPTDTTPPSITIDTLTVPITVTDGESGVAYVEVRLDGLLARQIVSAGQPAIDASVTVTRQQIKGAGLTVDVTARDVAGNTATARKVIR